MSAGPVTSDRAVNPPPSMLTPLPRRELGPAILTLLILLRLYVIAAIPIVAYAFIRALLVKGH